MSQLGLNPLDVQNPVDLPDVAPDGFVRLHHPDTGGVADIPNDAAGHYRSRGWTDGPASDEPAAPAEPEPTADEAHLPSKRTPSRPRKD